MHPISTQLQPSSHSFRMAKEIEEKKLKKEMKKKRAETEGVSKPK